MDQNLLLNNGVDVEKGIELLGDKATYDEMLGNFITESETRLPDIQKFKDAVDMPNYSILVHAMKSDSKYLGFTQLADLSLQHELKSKANDVAFVNEHYNELMTEANRIITLIKQYLGKEM